MVGFERGGMQQGVPSSSSSSSFPMNVNVGRSSNNSQTNTNNRSSAGFVKPQISVATGNGNVPNNNGSRSGFKATAFLGPASASSVGGRNDGNNSPLNGVFPGGIGQGGIGMGMNMNMNMGMGMGTGRSAGSGGTGTNTPGFSPRFSSHQFASPGNTGSEPNSRAQTPNYSGGLGEMQLQQGNMSPPMNVSGSIPVGRSGSARQSLQQQQHVSFEPSSVGSTGSSFHPSRSMRKGSLQQHHPYSRSGSTTPSEPPPSPWGGMNGSYPFPGLTPLHEGKGQSFGYGAMQNQSQNQNQNLHNNNGMSTSSSLTNTPFGSFGADPVREMDERDRLAEENTYWNALNSFSQQNGGSDEGNVVNGGSSAGFRQTNSVPTSGAATPLNGQPQVNMADFMSPEFVALLNSAEGAGLSDEAVAAAINGLVQQGGLAQFTGPEFGSREAPPAVVPPVNSSSSQSLLTRRLQQQQQQQQQQPPSQPFERQGSEPNATPFGQSNQGDARRTSQVSGFAASTPSHFSSSLPGSSGRLGTSQRSAGQSGNKSGNAFGSPHLPSSGFSSSFGYTPGSLNTNRSGGWGPSRGVGGTPTTPMTIPSSLSTSVSGPQQPQTPFQAGSVPGSSFGTSAKSLTSKVSAWR
jgi:hypothetical protein